MSSESADPLPESPARVNYTAALFMAALAAALWLLPWIASPRGYMDRGDVWGGDFHQQNLGKGYCSDWRIQIGLSNEGTSYYTRQFFGAPHPYDETSAARLHKYLTAGLA